jgi:5-(aminomethyl)-3-furanmethanol phosphate kinase
MAGWNGWIVKAGGSLCSDATGLRRASQWLRDHLDQPLLVVAGGGILADRVRELDRRVGLASDVAHRMALRTMRANLILLREQFGKGAIWSTARLPQSPAEQLNWLDVEPWLTGHPREEKSWRFTSDSIAALVAIEMGAQRLVLLKRRPVPATRDWTELARLGIVDECFPAFATSLSQVLLTDLSAGPG